MKVNTDCHRTDSRTILESNHKECPQVIIQIRLIEVGVNILRGGVLECEEFPEQMNMTRCLELLPHVITTMMDCVSSNCEPK